VALLQFCDLLFQLNLSQLINKPTHIQGNTLDLVITMWLFIPTIISPYLLTIVLFPFISSAIKHTPKSTPQFVFDYSKADYNGLNNFLLNMFRLLYLWTVPWHRVNLVLVDQEQYLDAMNIQQICFNFTHCLLA